MWRTFAPCGIFAVCMFLCIYIYFYGQQELSFGDHKDLLNLISTVSAVSTVTATIYEKVGEVEFDVYNIPLEIILYLKSHVKSVTYPILISSVLNVTDINITTGKSF